MREILLLAVFGTLFVLAAIYLSNLWGRRVAEPEYLPEPKQPLGEDFIDKVSDLTYGDISRQFSTSINPARPDVPFSETHHGDAPRGEFGPGSVFSVPEEVKERIKEAPNKGKYYG